MKKIMPGLFISVLLLLLGPLPAVADDASVVRACLNNWGKHPFNARHPKYRVFGTKVRVFGIGGKVRDTVHTDRPELVLIKPNVSVMSKSNMDLLNPNGWYCLRGKVNVMSSTTINLDCRAHIASSKPGVTVLGGNSESREKEVTVLGGARIIRVGCNKSRSHSGGEHASATASANNDLRQAQQKLAELGYSPGPADGLMGGKTANALSAYQKDNGLEVTGRLTEETMKALKGQQVVAEDSGSDTDISAKLRKLDRLRKDGLITDEEYEVLKAKAIRDYQ
ncbi:peptidoglycan-binding protein [Thiolapillus brandeum]|nr:peptidoglycan-binding protein [Thiolapillus brandeum]